MRLFQVGSRVCTGTHTVRSQQLYLSLKGVLNCLCIQVQYLPIRSFSPILARGMARNVSHP